MRAGGSVDPPSADPSQSRIDRLVSTMADGGRSDHVVRARNSARIRETGAMRRKMLPQTSLRRVRCCPEPAAADARAQELPLVGGGEHEWAYLLGELHWLRYDQRLSRIIWTAGVVVYIAAIAMGLGRCLCQTTLSARISRAVAGLHTPEE